MNPWRSRILRSEMVPVADILFNPKNWRIHPQAQQDALRGILSEVGWVNGVLINERTGHLIDGHARVLEADKNGEAEVPATIVDLSEDEEALVLASLDPLAAMATADKEKLDGLLREAGTGDAALMAMFADLAAKSGLKYGAGEGAGEAPARGGKGPAILITCATEEEQESLMARFADEGLQCRAL